MVTLRSISTGVVWGTVCYAIAGVCIAQDSLDKSDTPTDVQNFTPEDVARHFGKTHYERERAQESFKTRTQNAFLKPDESRVFYRLPTGDTIKGYLLPNNRIAPGFMNGYRIAPGCLDHELNVHPAEWRDEQLVCLFPQSLFAMLQRENIQLPEQTQARESHLDSDSNVVAIPADALSNQQMALTVNLDGVKDVYNNVEDSIRQKSRQILNKIDDYNTEAPSSNTNTETSARHPTNTTVQPIIAKVSPDYIYVPPARVSASDNTSSGQVTSNRQRFGINKNTWLKVELRRTVSTADRGEVELYLLENVPGRYRDIPRGTTFYGSPRINMALRRMDIIVSNGMLDNELEFDITAAAHDVNQQYGLMGKLIRNREGEVESAVGRGAIAAARDAIRPIAGEAGAAVDSISGDLIDYEETYAPQAPRAIIQVVPQVLYLKVSEKI